MEKLSSILPSNSRIRSVDLKSSQASRPGVPNFGQRMGTTSTTQDKVDLGRAVRDGARAMQDTLAMRNPKEAEHRRIAEEAARNFFDTRLRPEPRETAVLEDAPPATEVPAMDSTVISKVEMPSAAEFSPAEESGGSARSLDLYA